MTESSAPATHTPLGVGEIISDSFSILFGNFFKVFILGFIGAFFGFIIIGLFTGFGVAAGTAELDPTVLTIGIVIPIVINMVVNGLVTALLIQLAYDAKLGRTNTIGEYFRSALPAILPILVLSLAIGILSMIGFIALIIGALWVYAVFYVMAPVAVIEHGGFGSMGRSAELTKEYRWPIIGLSILIILIAAAINFVAGFLIGVLGSIAGPIFAGIGTAMLNGLSYAFGGIVVALVYARLREIKEGVDVDQIASVFD